MSERQYRPEPDHASVDRMKAVEKEMKELEEELKKDVDPYHGPNAVRQPTRSTGGLS